MPPTELLDLNGEQRNIFGDPSTKVVVVVFTRSDCPISNRNAPEIIQLCSKYQKQAVRIFLVYVDPRESAEAIRTHLRDYRYPCEAIRDPRHVLVKQTGATVTPEAVVFDAGRRIAYRGRINDLYVELGKSRPRATRHDLDDAIAAALLDQRVTRPVTEPIGCYIEDLE
jgi:peroxiredoxin